MSVRCLAFPHRIWQVLEDSQHSISSSESRLSTPRNRACRYVPRSQQVLACEALWQHHRGYTSRILVLSLKAVKPLRRLACRALEISDLLQVLTASKINGILSFCSSSAARKPSHHQADAVHMAENWPCHYQTLTETYCSDACVAVHALGKILWIASWGWSCM